MKTLMMIIALVLAACTSRNAVSEPARLDAGVAADSESGRLQPPPRDPLHPCGPPIKVQGETNFAVVCDVNSRTWRLVDENGNVVGVVDNSALPVDAGPP